jgi:hypothetical protein
VGERPATPEPTLFVTAAIDCNMHEPGAKCRLAPKAIESKIRLHKHILDYLVKTGVVWPQQAADEPGKRILVLLDQQAIGGRIPRLCVAYPGLLIVLCDHDLSMYLFLVCLDAEGFRHAMALKGKKASWKAVTKQYCQ